MYTGEPLYIEPLCIPVNPLSKLQRTVWLACLTFLRDQEITLRNQYRSSIPVSP